MPAIANPRVKTVESNPATLRSYPNAWRIAGSKVGKICRSAAFIAYARHRMTRKTMDNAREYGKAGPEEDFPLASIAPGVLVATLFMAMLLSFRFPNLCLAVPLVRRRSIKPIELVRRRLHDDALDPGIVLVTIDTVFSSDPALLVTSPGRRRTYAVVIVDPDDARFELFRHRVRAANVVGPDGHSQTEPGAVGEVDCLLFGVIAQDAHDRAEDLLLRDRHAVGDVGEHGGADVPPRGGYLGSSVGQRGSLANARLDELRHPVELALRDQRSDVCAIVERRAHAQLAYLLDEGRREAIVHAVGDQDAGALHAGLAAGDVTGEYRAVHGCHQVRVVKDDRGSLAAQLSRNLDQIAPCCRGNGPAGWRSTSQIDLGQGLVFGQCLARNGAEPMHHVDDTLRHAAVADHFRKHVDRQRSQFRGLDDDCVARGQRRSQFLGEDQQRVVPGGQQADNPERLTPRIVQIASPKWRQSVFQRFRDAGEIIIPFGEPSQLRAHFADWASRYASFGLHKGRHVLPQFRCQRAQRANAKLDLGAPAATAERTMRCLHRIVHILRRAVRNFRGHLLGFRADQRKVFSRYARDEMARDKLLTPLQGAHEDRPRRFASYSDW